MSTGKKAWRESLRKADDFVSFFDQVVRRTQANRKVVAILIVAALAGVAAWVTYRHFEGKNDVAAANALAPILDDLSAEPTADDAVPGQDWSAQADKLSKFLDQYGRSSSSPMARLYLGKARMKMGKYDAAREEFRRAQNNLPVPYLFLAREGEAVSWMQEMKWTESEAIWKELSQNEKNPFRDMHTWQLGISQESAKKTDEAFKTYSMFETTFPNSPLLGRVQERLAILKLPRPKS